MAHNHQHSHGVEDVGDGILLWTVIVNLGLSVFEFGAGLVSGSVALMADALHNTNDAAALLIAYIARKISRKGADEQFTFGYRRAELIGAMIQLTALILVGLYLVVEAVQRFFDPHPLLGLWIMGASMVALVVDIATAWLLWAMSKGSLNVRAAFLHNLTDAGASLAVLIGGAAIFWLDWTWVDPLISLGIAGYILWMSIGMIRRTSTILMEGSPPDFPFDELRDAVKALDGVADLHHLHVWELDEHHRALEAHIVIDPAFEDSPAARRNLRQRVKNTLADSFDIAHSTLEIETAEHPCGDSEKGHH
ncbi:MAG: cation diffusion facilitator family transporter [Kiritimatiellae bacterium]|jgi:cobalt-zinc-cadmium efflux system protein|nr:cation diffusion facilitator family transporter [Kiritimatiellia bacterium]